VNPALAVVNIDWVEVGNPGNVKDPLTGFVYGSVAYTYSIGKYEVTNAQYAEFLNAKGKSNTAGIYDASMAGIGIFQSGSSGSFSYQVHPDYVNKPVQYVSWFDAARFSNWLGNGQGTGDMETGAYTLDGATSGGPIYRNSGATVWIPSVNEWYKAAYFDPRSQAAGGPTGNDYYWRYPTQSDTITTNDANFLSLTPYYTVGQSTDVGTYSDDPSFFGTYDQGGNIWELHDTWMEPTFGPWQILGSGGDFFSTENKLASGSSRYLFDDVYDGSGLGFRVAGFAPVPEPRSMFLGLALLTSGLLRRNRGRTSL
jgi:formylglycine-generating enzyme required for sulfatase activity